MFGVILGLDLPHCPCYLADIEIKSRHSKGMRNAYY